MTRRRCGGIAALVLAAVLAPLALQAAPTVIYRCTGADGGVTFQNDTPCAAGQQQQRRVIDIAAPIPAFTAPPAAPERAPAVPMISSLPTAGRPADPTPDDATPRPAPPALFTCRVYDNRSYWREDNAPPPRCRPLQTVGIGGLPGMGAGQACEMHADVCTDVPEAELCLAWDNRVREAEFRWRFGEPGDRDAARVDYERLFKVLQDSHCAQPVG